MDYNPLIYKFGLVLILSILFGVERQKAHKPIGFATSIFVSLGACALTIVAVEVFPENPQSIIAAIVSGIGFLGAGALIKTSDKIFGFTSAAMIWLFAIFGVIVALGQYVTGLILYILIWVVVLVDRYLEAHGMGSYQKKILITTNKVVSEKSIKNVILTKAVRCKLQSAEIDKTKNTMTLSYLIEGSKDAINTIPQMLWEKEWINSCKVE